MNTAIAHDESLFAAWADAEAAYEAFLAQHELIDVRMMADADFERWKADYGRLYRALYDAQLAAYSAMREELP